MIVSSCLKKKTSKREEELYAPIQGDLFNAFSCLGSYYSEVTASRHFTNTLRKAFSKDTLYILKVEGVFPDITGFLKTQYSTDVVTVEVKSEEISIKDLYQAKEQGEIFNAKYALLISSESLPEEIRRFILDRRSIYQRVYGDPIIIAQYMTDTRKFDIDKELYFNNLPEPFRSYEKTLTMKAEELNMLGVNFTGNSNNASNSLGITLQNTGKVILEIADTIVNSRYYASNVMLEVGASKAIQISNMGWVSGSEYNIELVSRNGKKFKYVVTAP